MSAVKGAKQVNRAEIIDLNFTNYVKTAAQSIDKQEDLLAQSGLTPRDLLELFESQIINRHLDLMARVLRLENRVFYTIGSSGHEGNAVVGRLTRHTDPAFLHYRSGAFMMERSRKVPGIDAVHDTALSFAASAEDVASGGRHKVWGSRPLWVIPQTSTIASHLPKAVGAALAVDHARRIGFELPIPDDSIVVCSFGDASLNHSTAQGAINSAQWSAHQGLPVPVLFVCEDNGWGISVRTPSGWVERMMRAREGIHYIQADGLDLAAAWPQVQAAVERCRRRRQPVFLHLKTVRLMGHAGTDFEVDYREIPELEAAEARDPLLRSATLAMASGVLDAEEVLELYETVRRRCFEAADRADGTPKLTSREEVMRPLAPLDADAVHAEAARGVEEDRRVAVFGSPGQLPERQPPRHLAVNINRALHDLMVKYPQMLLFGEDVARKGGVYTVTRELMKAFGGARVFNTLLDEQTILGLAQGFGTLGMLPFPEIQYLAYFHNACDQIRGEACSLQFFSNEQFANPMVMRIAGLGYQKGFGGHFHNDNSFAALRDIPGLVIGCPSRGDDAVLMLRTLAALARTCGRVCAFLEPIALYMTRDLHAVGDGEWLFAYPEQGKFLPLGEPRLYEPFADQLLIITYGNGVPMSLRAARRLQQETGHRVRVMDLRWLAPLNEEAILEQARQCRRVLVVDEGRYSGGISEAIMALIGERLPVVERLSRVVGADTYTPLGAAAGTVLPSDDEVLAAARSLAAG